MSKLNIKQPIAPQSPSAFEAFKPLTYEISIGDKIKVLEDKKTKTRIANFPFEFPDGTRGIVILCKIKDEAWQPNADIKSLTLTFA